MATKKSHVESEQEGQQNGAAPEDAGAGAAGASASKKRAGKRVLLGGVLAGIVALAGILISTVLMLYDTVKDVIRVVGLEEKPGYMVVKED